MPLRVALFVEGSVTRPLRRSAPLEAIWRECLGKALSLHRFHLIVGINKKHLLALDPRKPKMSGGGEALDQFMVRMMNRQPFDAAVLAWDLVPAWNPEGAFCRWEETLDLYRFLAESQSLPPIWKEQAAKRYDDLRQRSTPGERKEPPRLAPGVLLPVCMEPMFEGLLVQDEAAVRRVLGLKQIPKGWPGHGWGEPSVRKPDQAVLAPAIQALFRMRPKPAVLRKIHGDMITHNHEWGELLLRELLADRRAKDLILSHPIAVRLKEIAARNG
jgi:hypothetical protein